MRPTLNSTDFYVSRKPDAPAGMSVALPGPKMITTSGKGSPRADRIAALRQVVAGLETPGATLGQMPLGLSQIDRSIPDLGLTCGALHEVAAAAHGDRPAAFGFLIALMASVLPIRRGPAVLIAARRPFQDFGEPYGHALRQLGLDVGRLVIVETRSDKDALWAMEEALRSGVADAVVAGAVEGDLDLTMSRRLSLAAAAFSTPFVLLRSSAATGTSAARMRWRVAAAPAARDRFGVLAFPRWSVDLERCRNGRPGRWLLEWDHATHRFRLAQGVADRAAAQGTGQKRLRLAG